MAYKIKAPPLCSGRAPADATRVLLAPASAQVRTRAVFDSSLPRSWVLMDFRLLCSVSLPNPTVSSSLVNCFGWEWSHGNKHQLRMTGPGAVFVKNSVTKNVTALDPSGDPRRATNLARRCIAEAAAEGITLEEIQPKTHDLGVV